MAQVEKVQTQLMNSESDCERVTYRQINCPEVRSKT